MTSQPEGRGAGVARRFRTLAILASAGVILAGVMFAIVALALAASRGLDPNALAAIVLVVVILIFLLIIGAGAAYRHGAAIRVLRARFPDGAVFLARRQPSIVTDVETWMSLKGITAQISDGWMPAVVDDRGISAWTSGRKPTELLLMDWAEVGEIAMTKTAVPVGAPTWKVSVDVRPFDIPLTVEIGYSRAFVTAALGQADTADVVRIVNALRPPGAPTAG